MAEWEGNASHYHHHQQHHYVRARQENSKCGSPPPSGDKRKNRSIVLPDGNKSRKKGVCLPIHPPPVRHSPDNTKTFVKPVKKSKNKALSTLAGTQTLDRTCLSLKTWLGKSPEAKGKMDDDSCSRQELRKQISQWAWSKRCASLSRAISCSPLYSSSAEPES